MDSCILTLEELSMDTYISSLEPFTSVSKENITTSLESLSKIWWKGQCFFAEFLAEMMIKKMKLRGQCNDALLYLFSDNSWSRIRHVNLSTSKVSDTGLGYLKCQNVIELDVSHCQNLTLTGLMQFVESQPTLQVLKMNHMSFSNEERLDFKTYKLDSLKNLKKLDVSFTKLPAVFLRDTLRYTTEIVCLNLEGCHHLVGEQVSGVGRVSFFDISDYVENGEHHLSNIVDLDLSNHTVTCLHPLLNAKKTVSRLILYDCKINLDMVMDVVTQLDNLQVLDISRKEKPDKVIYRWKVENKDLELLSTLPCLTDLDLSVVANFGNSALDHLRTRPTKLKFLGLAQTMCCRYKDIPADMVTGNSGEKQVVATIRKYTKRPKYIIIAFECLEELQHDHVIQNVTTAIEVVIQAIKAIMGHYIVVKKGSILLYFLTSNELDGPEFAAIRNKVLDLVVEVMETFSSNAHIQRTCCFIMCNLKLPHNMHSHMPRIIHLLIQMTMNHEDEHSSRISVTVLNACVCHIAIEQKKVWGSQIIQVMLKIIKRELDYNKTGIVLNHAWSTLWNITDETAANSQMFIEMGGLHLFHRCISDHEDVELIRNILGMIGNVAEVAKLQHHLMNSKFVQTIYNSLSNETSDLETRYNVCGILCHLAGCNKKAWKVAKPTRDEVLHKVEQEIEGWDVTCQRKMSYMSFKPLLRLLESSYPLQTHYWVVWALRNFCLCDPKKYYGLLVNEGGLPLLERLVQNPFTDKRISALTSSILADVDGNTPDPQDGYMQYQ